MILNLDAENRIRSTDRCWQTEHIKVFRGESKWVPWGYFSRMESALTAAVQREIRVSPVEGVKDAIARCDELCTRLAELIEGAK